MEALAIVSLAGNVVQFIDFGSRLCKEIHEYSNAYEGAPQKVRDIERRMSLILKTLEDIGEDGRAELDHERQTIEESTINIKKVLTVLDTMKLTPRPISGVRRRHEWFHRGLNRMEVGWKGFKVLCGDDKIDALQLSLDRLVALLTLQLQVKANKNLHASTEAINHRVERLRLDTQAREVGTKHIIPFIRNAKFVGRESVINNLEQKFSLSEHRAALYGLGGVGKTQIALEYIFRLKERSTNFSIFWVYANNVIRFEEAYKRIASDYDLPGHQDPNSNLLQLVRDWLERDDQCKWFMVVDNVDDASVFYEQRLLGKSMAEYVPQTPNGRILYTTRSRDIAVDLSSDRDPIQVGFMSTEEANELLDKSIRDASSSDERLDLLQELDYLPLAITQAMAYMAKRRISMVQYLELFKASDVAKIRLLNHEFSDHGREGRASDSVAKTWMISFDLLKSNHPRAADLLSSMSFLDRQSVPRSLLIDDEEDEWDLSDALEILLAFSLIKVNESDGTYSMHRLVQILTRSWLDSGTLGDGKRHASKTLRVLAERFPDGMTRGSVAPTYLPHADRVLASEIKEISLPDKLNQAALLRKTAKYYCSSAHLDIAETRAKKAHSIQTETLGRLHPDTVASLSSLGWINNRLRRYSVTQNNLQPVLDTLIGDVTFPVGILREATNVLAQALISQNQLESAEILVRRVIPDQSVDRPIASAFQQWEKPSQDDLKTYRLVVTLGRRYLHAALYEAAEQHYRRALILYERASEKFSNNMDETARSMISSISHGIVVAIEGLALSLSHRGRLEEAEVLYRKVLTEREITYGSRSVSTLVSLHHLAKALSQQQKWDEAEKMWERLCHNSEEFLGSEHKDTVRYRQSHAEFLETRSQNAVR